MAIDGGRITAFLELDTSGYGSAMDVAKKKLSVLSDSSASWSAKLTGVGDALQAVGSTLTTRATVPIVALGTAAAKAAITYESAFAGVRKTVDATDSEYQALSDSIKDMSGRIPQSAAGLAQIMEIAGQLGVDKGNLSAFTETIANLGVATNLSGEEAATMLAQYANVTGMDLSSIGRLGSVIVGLGNNCATTEKDITEMAQRLAGTGALLDLSDAQIMGLSATMASLGIGAEAGGSAMSRTLQYMQSAVLSGGDDLMAFADVAGLSADGFARAFKADPMDALNSFIEGLGRVKDSGGDAAAALGQAGLSDIRMVDTLLRMAGAQGQLTSNIQLASDAWDANTALTNEASKRYETTESQLQLAQNSVTNMMSSLGAALLPTISQASGKVAELADSFAGLDGNAQSAILATAGGIAALGPVTTILGTVTKALTSPAGLIALAGVAGIALVNAISSADKAAQKARLAQRFGEITLSAEEMSSVVDHLVKAPYENLDALNELSSDVAQAAGQAKQSIESMQKLTVKAQLGMDVDEASLQASAQQAIGDVKAVIDAQQLSTQMLITAVFGENSESGGDLAASFTGYFSGLHDDASAVGRELMQKIGAAMADGIMTADEQAAINKLSAQLQHIKTQAMLDNTSAEISIMAMNARDSALSADSLIALEQQTSEKIQEGIQTIRDKRDVLRAQTAQMGAENGWSRDEIAARDQTIIQGSAKEEAAWTAAQVENVWNNVGSQITDAFGETIKQVQKTLPQLMQNATAATDAWADSIGVDKQSAKYASKLRDNLRQAFASSDWTDVVTPEVRQSAQTMYQALAPTQEVLRALSDQMGEDFPPVLQNALDSIYALQLAATGKESLAGMFTHALTDNTGDVRSAGDAAGQAAVEGAQEGSAAMPQVGAAAAAGFVSGADSGTAAAFNAGRQLGNAFASGASVRLEVKSPSRVMRRIGAYAVEGFTGGLDGGYDAAYRSGYHLAQAAIDAAAQAQDSHSPSRKWAQLGLWAVQGYALATSDGFRSVSSSIAGTVGTYIGDAAAAELKRRRGLAAAAAAQAAAAAEAARNAAILKQINTGAAAIARADAAAYDRRMTALSAQTSAMMQFAGAHSVWYQDDKGETESQAAKDRYDAQIEKENADYAARKAKNGWNQEQEQAAKDAHDKRLELLKSQRDAEVAAIKEQYALQKQMAADWLQAQKDQLQAAFDQKRAAYDEEDYQDELADLKKKQRQSKSAREKRELQEQIDKMERDHALEAEEDALQQTLAGYDALADAVNQGLIGLGDLTGSQAFGSLAFGTAGLTGIDTITDAVHKAVQSSLSASSLQQATGIASEAQLLAALQSANTATISGSLNGSTYQIDLRGAVVRDDSDITAIVDELEKRLRAAGR